MDNVSKFPFTKQRLHRDMDRLKRWAQNYERHPIEGEDDFFQRMDDLLAFVRITMVDSIFAQQPQPPELKVTQGVILDIMDFLPNKLAKAMALEHFYPAMASQIPDFTDQDDAGDDDQGDGYH